MVLGAFKPSRELSARAHPPAAAGLDAGELLEPVLASSTSRRYFVNSVLIAVRGDGRQPAVLLDGRLRAGEAATSPGARRSSALVLATLMVPGSVTLVPLFVLMSKLGLVNTLRGA